MSQHINFLSAQKSAVQPAMVALVVWGLAILGIFAMAGINQLRISAAKGDVAASEANVQRAQATLQQRVKDTGADITAEIEKIKARAELARQLLTMASALGSAGGFAGHFTALASATEDGIWLNQISVSQSGKAMQIAGRALDKDAMPEYTQRVNAALADKGVKVSSIELTSESVQMPQSNPSSPGGGTDVAPLKVTKFTLR